MSGIDPGTFITDELQVTFVWIPHMMNFSLTIKHLPTGAQISGWLTPAGAIGLYNISLAQIRRAAKDPSKLPADPIRLEPETPPADASASSPKEGKLLVLPGGKESGTSAGSPVEKTSPVEKEGDGTLDDPTG